MTLFNYVMAGLVGLIAFSAVRSCRQEIRCQAVCAPQAASGAYFTTGECICDQLREVKP